MHEAAAPGLAGGTQPKGLRNITLDPHERKAFRVLCASLLGSLVEILKIPPTDVCCYPCYYCSMEIARRRWKACAAMLVVSVAHISGNLVGAAAVTRRPVPCDFVCEVGALQPTGLVIDSMRNITTSTHWLMRVLTGTRVDGKL